MNSIKDELERLRVQAADAHGDELTMVARLAAALEEQDQELQLALSAVLEDHRQRRTQIAHSLHALALRIGHLPAIDIGPPPALGPEMLAALTGGRHHA